MNLDRDIDELPEFFCAGFDVDDSFSIPMHGGSDDLTLKAGVVNEEWRAAKKGGSTSNLFRVSPFTVACTKRPPVFPRIAITCEECAVRFVAHVSCVVRPKFSNPPIQNGPDYAKYNRCQPKSQSRGVSNGAAVAPC